MTRGSGGRPSLSRRAKVRNTSAVETGDAGIDQHQRQRRNIRDRLDMFAGAAGKQRPAVQAHRHIRADGLAEPGELVGRNFRGPDLD